MTAVIDNPESSLERTFTPQAVELRSGELRIGGLGAVFGSRSRLLNGGEAVGKFFEEFDHHAFDESRDQGWPFVKCLAEHDSRMLLGAVHSRTLELTITPSGVDYECLLPDSPLGHNTYASVARRDYAGSSFQFVCNSDIWRYQGGMAVRTVQLARLGEVGPVTIPAYTGSSVALRSLARHMDADPAEVEMYAHSGQLGRFFKRSDGGSDQPSRGAPMSSPYSRPTMTCYALRLATLARRHPPETPAELREQQRQVQQCREMSR